MSQLFENQVEGIAERLGDSRDQPLSESEDTDGEEDEKKESEQRESSTPQRKIVRAKRKFQT